MTELTVYGLRAMGAAAAGGSFPTPPPPLDLEAFRLWAYRNGGATLLYPGIKHHLPDAVKEIWKADYKTMRMNAAVRAAAAAGLLRVLGKDGVRPVVLKGHALAGLYASPDDRISNDLDLYAEPEQFEPVQKALERMGAQAVRSIAEHHDVYSHPVLGDVEIHRHVVLDNLTDPGAPLPFLRESYVEFDYGGAAALTLGITDHLLLLLMHAVGHALTGGFTARQLLDIALYMRSFASQAVMSRVGDIVRELRYDGLVGALLTIAEGFGLDGFTPAPFERAPEHLADQLAADILECYGYERDQQSKAVTLQTAIRARAKSKEKPGGAARLLYSLTIPARYVALEYPWALHSPAHMLFARMRRIARSVRRAATGLARGNETADRLRLYRDLGLL